MVTLVVFGNNEQELKEIESLLASQKDFKIKEIKIDDHKIIQLTKTKPQGDVVNDEEAVPRYVSAIELRILVFVAKGYKTKEIANKLCLCYGTIRNYISSAMRKLGLHDRTQIAIYIIKHGLIDL
jgi:DNA-binding NarL/FixJ family response regulator